MHAALASERGEGPGPRHSGPKNFSAFGSNIVWDLPQASPRLWKRLQKENPALTGLLPKLTKNIPHQVVPTVGNFDPYVRPHRHWRAFYHKVDEALPDSGWLAFKGTEPAARDLSPLVEAMLQFRTVFRWSIAQPNAPATADAALLPLLERYALLEHKVPTATLLREALDEARLGLTLQEASIERYGTLAHLPLPLLVHRFPEEIGQRLKHVLEPHLSPAAVQAVHQEIEHGLGVLVYWYPNLPHRIAYVEVPPVGLDMLLQKRLGALAALADPQSAVEGWISGLAKMLCLALWPRIPCAP